MQDIINLNTYKKYQNLIDDGLIIVPDNFLTKLIKGIKNITREKPIMNEGEVHEVELNARKVQITSRGSLRTVAVDGIHFDSIEQAACNMYDPYDEYIDLSNVVRDNALDFTFIPIVDVERDTIRYTISKYSKGLRKYFDPHKVVKAIYSLNNILFYVKDEKDNLKKYYYKISSINMNDVLPLVCSKYTEKNGMNNVFYLAFFLHEEDLPFTIGACKDDFYALKDILNKISFKGTTPLKYMIFKDLSDHPNLKLKEKEELAYSVAMVLTNKTKKELCVDLDITVADYDNMMRNNLLEINSQKGKKVTRNHILKYLHIMENVNELKFYEKINLMWKVKYDDIPS